MSSTIIQFIDSAIPAIRQHYHSARPSHSFCPVVPYWSIIPLIPGPMAEGDRALELSKVLSKTMQCSYKRKEVEELVGRVLDKTERVIQSGTEPDRVRRLRMEFEKVRMAFYDL